MTSGAIFPRKPILEILRKVKSMEMFSTEITFQRITRLLLGNTELSGGRFIGGHFESTGPGPGVHRLAAAPNCSYWQRGKSGEGTLLI